MSRWKAPWLVLMVTLIGTPALAKEEAMQIKINVNGKALTATMEDNPTARDFVSLLPLTVTLNDYDKTEKISDLPKKLTKEGAPTAITPKAGDITFYAPWGNLAIFYRDGHHSPGLIKLGTIDANADAFNFSGSKQATIEIQNNSTEN